jgi:hypothetical protein
MTRLSLPTVTLCAAASVNVAATARALKLCLDQIDFAECLFFGVQDIGDQDRRIKCVDVPALRSAADYSHFVLQDLADHVNSSHALIVQWDGYVLDAARWDPRFLDCDYIGAPWPQFHDGHDVGNGGFSLRSRRLMEACCDPRFIPGHPEDVVICRRNRLFLEHKGIRFAERALAQTFSFERTSPAQPTFGFHGIFNMIPTLGADDFWEVYQTLDDRKTATVDVGLLMRQLGSGPHAMRRRLRLTVDYLVAAACR